MKHAKHSMTAAARRLIAGALTLAVLTLPLTVVQAPPARSQCFSCDGCEFAHASTTAQQVSQEHIQTRDHFGTHSPLPDGTGEIGEHQGFLINYMFLGVDNIGGILPALMLMTQQMSAVMMHQMWIVGSFLDAKHQMETQLLFQELGARAHKTYHPSVGMCVLGTNVRSLARTERYSRLTAHVMAQYNLRRQTGNLNTNSGEGMEQDRAGRLANFMQYFCDQYDNNHIDGTADSGLALMCPGATVMTANMDIDYTRTIEIPRTLTIDYAENGVAPFGAEEGFSSMLFSHNVLPRLDVAEAMFKANHDEIQDMRALIAKRSVIQTSLNNILGMKAFGSPAGDDDEGSSFDTSQYMRRILFELGVTDPWAQMNLLGRHESAAIDGDPTLSGIAFETNMRPSYYAQMEVLTKRLYQNPAFFTSLYDTPANVKRKGAALQALGLMLQRDIYDSYLRNEMLMSMLLEARLERAQRDAVADSRVMSDY